MGTGRSIQGITQHPLHGRAWRELAQLAGEALVAGLLVSLVLALAIVIATTQAQAAESARAAGEPRPAQGTLVLRPEPGEKIGAAAVPRED